MNTITGAVKKDQNNKRSSLQHMNKAKGTTWNSKRRFL